MTKFNVSNKKKLTFKFNKVRKTHFRLNSKQLERYFGVLFYM